MSLSRPLLLLCLLACVAAPSAQAAPQWLAPHEIPGSAGGIPEVDVNARGDAVAGWLRSYPVGSEGDSYEIPVVSVRPAGGQWSAPVELVTGQASAVSLRVGIDGAGNALAVWQRSSPGPQQVMGAELPAGGAWSQAVPVSSGNAGAYLQLTVNEAGLAVAAWRGFTTGELIQASIHQPGQGWSVPKDVSDPAAGAFIPSVAVNASGRVGIAWPRIDGAAYKSEVRFKPPGADWEPIQTMSTAGSSGSSPVLALDDAGNAAGLYLADKQDVGATLRYVSRPAGAGAWTPEIELSPDPSADQALLFDGAGGLTAAWRGKERSDWASVIRTRTLSGGQWSPVERLSAHDVATTKVQLARMPAGQVMAAWGELGSSATRASIRNGGRWSPATAVTPPSLSTPNFDSDTDGEGNALAAVLANDSKIYAIPYDGAGPRITNVQGPTAGQTAQPLSFSASVMDVWSPLQSTVWNFGDGGAGQGAAVQHAFGSAGAFDPSITATDTAGNSTTAGAARVNITAAPVPPGLINASFSYEFAAFRTYTLLRKATVKGVPAGAVVRITCKAKRKRCPFKVKTFRKGKTVNVAKLFKRRRVKTPATLEIRVTKPGMIGRHFKLVVRKANSPRLTKRCLQPGATKPSACPAS